MRLVCQYPIPETIKSLGDFSPVAKSAYGLLEIKKDANIRNFRSLVQEHFTSCDAIGFSKLESVKAVFFDMDATVIRQESLVELARSANKSKEVEQLTEKAMRGEMDFKTSLLARLSLLAGLPAEDTINKVLQGIDLQPGISEFLLVCQSLNVDCYLISGGFTAFAEPLAKSLGFRGSRSNVLEISQGKLTGRVTGRVIDAEAKRDYVLEMCEKLGMKPQEVAAVGDGANDRLMLEAVGVAIGFDPKPALLPYLDGITKDHRFLGPLLFGC